MTEFHARIGVTTRGLPKVALCDAWLADGRRFGDQHSGLDAESVLGRWPGELETDAVVRLAHAVGEAPSWEIHAATPPVAQKLAERARPQPLDLEIIRHLRHLQHVCHQPRLHLRVEEERLPVSRARRTLVRAVAELVSHPGDWEHRTLRSIQPSRVLARQVEDEWNLYENRVAARLVDHLLTYVAKRLEALRKIKEILEASRDYGDEIRRTSFRRARRIAELWSNTLESKTEEELSRTMQRLELAQRDLQALLDSPLYQRLPRRQSVALSLKPTNILLNDAHYRRVGALWRSWVKFGHTRQETHEQRAERRQLEAAAWDRFVLHLVVRGFEALGWTATAKPRGGWRATKDGWTPVGIDVDGHGVVSLTGTSTMRFLPVCANLARADEAILRAEIETMDVYDGEIVVTHVGTTVALADLDRASGWSFGGRAVLFGCSPWGIDSEERMARLLNGWLSRAAVAPYPVTLAIRGLPEFPSGWDWIRYEPGHLVALRVPDERESAAAHAWASTRAKALDAEAHRARQAKQAFAPGPRDAVGAFERFIDDVREVLAGIENCPVCDGDGFVEARPGRQPAGADATWWAQCGACGSEWGTRRCVGCGSRYRALAAQTGLDLAEVAHGVADSEWPDKVLGRDVWARPCRSGSAGDFRCPNCGRCSRATCAACSVPP